MGLSDCRRRGMRRLWLPCVPCPVPTAGTGLRSGSPGCLACSVVARSPQSPRTSWRMLAFVASPPMAGFTTFGRMAARQWCNEAETGSLALGLATSLSGGYQPPSSATRADRLVSRALSPPHAGAQLHVERTINMCSTSQLHRTRRYSRLNRKDTKIFITLYLLNILPESGNCWENSLIASDAESNFHFRGPAPLHPAIQKSGHRFPIGSALAIFRWFSFSLHCRQSILFFYLKCRSSESWAGHRHGAHAYGACRVRRCSSAPSIPTCRRIRPARAAGCRGNALRSASLRRGACAFPS